MHYLENLWNALDFGSLRDILTRMLSVLLCLTVHESCHALAALALGDHTAEARHRISLNPLHHIDWFGLAMMLTAGFGWAKPVPVDMRSFRHPKRDMALTALAGPVSNFLLAVLLMLAAKWVLPVWDTGGFRIDLGFFLLDTAILSIGLGLFNLVPIPPLDGSKVLFSLLPDRVYLRILRYERYGFIVLWALVLLGVGEQWMSAAIGWVVELLYRLIF